MEPRTDRLILILADISGYTKFMLANQLAAVHGQQFITLLIESIIREVESPLQLHEIQGDAVFLFAVHPGGEREWRQVCSQVGEKLIRFFEVFSEVLVQRGESGICQCAFCKNADVKLKLVVHSGKAVFHTIDRFSQVSGVDVIMVHRLLKNSVPGDEYLLMTEAAYRDLGSELDIDFLEGDERYEGFGSVKTYVHFMGEEKQRLRSRLYSMSSPRLAWRGLRFAGWAVWAQFPAFVEQVRHPVAEVGRLRRVAFSLLLALSAPFALLVAAVVIPVKLLSRRGREVRAG